MIVVNLKENFILFMRIFVFIFEDVVLDIVRFMKKGIKFGIFVYKGKIIIIIIFR